MTEPLPSSETRRDFLSRGAVALAAAGALRGSPTRAQGVGPVNDIQE